MILEIQRILLLQSSYQTHAFIKTLWTQKKLVVISPIVNVFEFEFQQIKNKTHAYLITHKLKTILNPVEIQVNSPS